MKVTDGIYYVGVNDHKVDLFEGQYPVPNGMAYNSYVIMDEKIAVMDTVDAHFGEEWLKNLDSTLNGKAPDYLIVHHMEPDHSANIAAFAERYPNAVLVATAKAFTMMNQFFGTDYADRRIVAEEGSTLSLGKHTLTFVTAPMVHWPEVMVSYESTEKVLFSADAFGKFGALDAKEDWTDEARRYYFGIVGKYGAQAQALLKKAAGLDIAVICPLHGPILTENLGAYLDLYNTWSSYQAESSGVFIAYASIYGHTGAAAEALAERLRAKGETVVICDLARTELSKAVENAFRYGKLVLASVTYNAEIFPFMRHFIGALTERGYQNRKIGLIENGSWAPMAAKVMRGMFEKSKNITFTETTVTVKSALNKDSEAQLDALAAELIG